MSTHTYVITSHLHRAPYLIILKCV